MKFALIHLGNEEQYGLLFAASEFKKHGEIRFFDAEMDNDFKAKIVDFKPDYACLSILTAFALRAQEIADWLRTYDIKVIVGGPHVLYSGLDVDYIVRGTAYNVFPMLGKNKVVVNPPLDPNEYPLPAREEYYRDIPRLKTRYRKVMASMFGCVYNCSYCASNCGNLTKMWGSETYKKAYLTRRNVDTIIKEAQFIKADTQEIEWVDDDFFQGSQDWMYRFIETWKKEINIPLYISTTSQSIVRINEAILGKLRSIVNCIGVGIQALEAESLKLFNRQWDNFEQMKKAYLKLKKFDYNVNLQAIIGLPVKEPIVDAISTIEGLKEIGKGEVVSVYPLQLYKGTQLYQYCIDNNIPLNSKCNGDTNCGYPAVKFNEQTENCIHNLCKLATMIVKYDIPFEWYMPLAMGKYDEESNKQLSLIRYRNCIEDRLGSKGLKIFNEIVKTMRIRY